MQKKIENFTVSEFRQLKGLEFRGLEPINLLVGENSCGKTSVLEAISLFSRPLDPLELINTARRREIKSSRERLLDGIRWLFPQRAVAPDDPYFQGRIAFEGTGPNLRQSKVTVDFSGQLGDAVSPTLETNLNDDNEADELSATTLPADAFNSRRGARISMACETHFGLDRPLFETEPEPEVLRHNFELWEDERYVSRASIEAPQFQVATISPVTHRVEIPQIRNLSGAIFADDKYSIVEAVRLIDPQIDNLEVISRSGIGSALWVHHRKSGFSPVNTLGDGTRRVLTIALQLHNIRHGILLIDEIETAIHRDALASMFKWLVEACKKFDVQLFATTHSLEAVDALLMAELDHPTDLAAFQLPDRNSSRVKRFDGEILEGLRFERGLDIR